MNRVVLKLSRHDHHSLEIKSIVELDEKRFSGAVDLFLFLPRSVQLHAWNKKEVLGDFRSRFRLAVPVGVDSGNSALEAAIAGLTGFDGASPQFTEALRRFAAVVAESVGLRAGRFRKLLKRPSRGAPLAALEEVRETSEWFNRVRAALDLVSGSGNKDVGLLDEYVSHLVVQYLGASRQEFERARASLVGNPDGVAAIEAVLDRIQEREGAHRTRVGYPDDFASDGAARERGLVRMSQLKKFFYQTLYLDVEKQAPLQKIAEPAAAAGAGLAALWMALFQRNVDASGAVFGVQGSALVATGVVAYVLKDRIKEWARRYFAHAVETHFPDVNQRLMVEHGELGRLKEWLRLGHSRSIPPDIAALRQRGSLTELEEGISEDVLHYRLKHDVRDSTRHGQWAVQSIVRVNLERYLKNMDDAYKDVSSLDPAGVLTTAKCHRVYPFYVVLRARHHFSNDRGRRSTAGRIDAFRLRAFSKFTKLAASVDKDKIYRVVMDKNGVDRVESVELR